MLAFTAALLLVSQVSAGLLGDAVHLARRDDATEQQMKRYVATIMEPAERRATTTNTTGLSGMNVTAWNTQTEAACTSALTGLNGTSSSDSGMAVCYNLPYLNNSTGVFEADLRLYMISAPKGAFANIASTDVQVGLGFNGATVSPISAASMKRSEGVSLISWPRGMGKRVTTPTLVQSYAFVGQINQDLLSTNMGTTALENVLVPAVTLTGKSADGSSVNTTLASNEATFVSGVFADEVAPTKAAVDVPLQTLVVASDAPFVLPGQKILIVPIGLIITSVWTVLFVGAIGYGTIGRIQFRDQYRRRSAQATKGGLARI